MASKNTGVCVGLREADEHVETSRPAFSTVAHCSERQVVRRSQLNAGLLLTGLLTACVGCNDGGGQVSGSVKGSDGAPIPAVRVICRNLQEPSIKASGVTDESGRYSLRWGVQDSVPPGAYEALLVPAQSLGEAAVSAARVPAEYSAFRTSGLRIEVAPGKTNHDFVVD